MGESGKLFQEFLDSRRADFHRIAARSRGDYSLDDVCGEAWVIAYDIGQKRGFDVDFSSVEDQELVLSWLYNRLINFAEKNIRFAVKLDKGWEEEDSESPINKWAKLLTGPENFDPLVWLEEEQERGKLPALIQHSYSQASAYAILLHRFDWDLESLATYLRRVVPTLRGRLIASGLHMKRQPSLFDRIQVVEYDFAPTVARSSTRPPTQDFFTQQLEWAFA